MNRVYFGTGGGENRRSAARLPGPGADGYELTFAVNHLGHFLLTNLLLHRLVAAAPSRIVIVSSGVHDPRRLTGMPKPDIRSLEALASTGCATTDRFRGGLAYVNSKVCNLWFAYELARRLDAAGLGRSGAGYYPSHTRRLETPLSEQSYDAARAHELWEASVAMSGLRKGESPLL